MYNKILEEIKSAMKARNTDKRDVLKQVQAKAQAIAKEGKCDITDEVVLQAINKEIKQLNQTADSLKGNEDTPLYQSTEVKIGVLNEYLPKMLSKEEVQKEVESILSSLPSETNFGAKMGAVMKALKGKADGKLIKEVVEQFK